MNLKTFIKEDGSIIDVYCQKSFNENHKDFLIFNSENKFHGIYYDWNEFLNINKIKECFDARTFTNIKGKSHTIILENDTVIPSEIFNAAKYANAMGAGKLPNILQPFLDLSKSSNKNGYDKYLYNYIKEKEIKNVFIDSVFKDKKQLENIAKGVFRWTNDVNIFINSHSCLLDVLNNYRNDEDFKRLVSVCNVYDIEFSKNAGSKGDFDNVNSKFIYKSEYYINWSTITRNSL